MKNEEIWKDVEGLECILQVSNKGRVRNLLNGKICSREVSQRGYYRVTVTVGGQRFRYKVHRLVAKAFVPNPLGLPQIDHIDGDKLNNDASNLQWADNATNSRKRMKDTKAKPVVVFYGDEHIWFPSEKAAARFLGVNRTSVMAACEGSQKMAGGCVVMFANE